MTHYEINDKSRLLYEPGIGSAPRSGQRQHYRPIKTLIGIAIVLVLGVMLLKGSLLDRHFSPANQTISQGAPDNTRMPKRL